MELFKGNLSPMWQMSFSVAPEASGVLLTVSAGNAPFLSVSREEGCLTARIHTKWTCTTRNFGTDPCFTFELSSRVAGTRVDVAWRGYSFRLSIDGALVDEDWPLGSLPNGPWQVQGEGVTDWKAEPLCAPAEDAEAAFEGSFQHFVMPGENTGVGDCMPFARDGRYCLYYLLDRRGHASKQHLGAHQWAQISSADLKHWTLHPIAVGITEQWEGSICTGSLIEHGGKVYAFYAVRMSDGSPARLTWAESSDGVHFAKSGRYFSLSAPYEPVSARDPMVFKDAAGRFHMLVTTSLMDMPHGGCLAHMTSSDLEHWVQHEPFLVPGYVDQPECSDYFAWNGWYYLVYSNFATARYRMSRSPFGPWMRPANDMLDACEVQVPKTAAFGPRRFSTGFLARRPRTYAGNAVTHELLQRADGTLGVHQLEEILPQATASRDLPDLLLQPESNRSDVLLASFAGDLRVRTTLKPETTGMLFGLTLSLPTPDGAVDYRLCIDPSAGTAAIQRPGEDFQGVCQRDQITGLTALYDGCPVDLLVMGDILDLMLSDGRAITMRLDHNTSAGARVSAFAMAGDLRISSGHADDLGSNAESGVDM